MGEKCPAEMLCWFCHPENHCTAGRVQTESPFDGRDCRAGPLRAVTCPRPENPIANRLQAHRMTVATHTHTEELLHELLATRILILDGAMGTMVQRHKLDEAAFRGSRFAAHP